MGSYGLLGEKLGHSYSPRIHAMLGEYAYGLFERTPEELDAFLKSDEFAGLNVTIPYKKTVVKYCAELSEMAEALGSVNTIVRRDDGSLYGDNTDAFGFESTLRHSSIEVKGKKALVLGSGGASVTVCAVLKKLGAVDVTVISRSGENNYENLHHHADAKIIVNTTPLGMYPKNGAAAVDLRAFPQCEGVVDIVYNPARTALMLQAEELGIPCAGGLHMLVAQAKRTSELFTGNTIADTEITRIERVLSCDMENVVLVGMPGSGKTTIASLLAQRLERPLHDADQLVVETAGVSIPEIFASEGEAGFRKRETAALEQLGKLSGSVISTGGGCVTREENYPLLHQNGRIFWLQRELDLLPKDGRPISQSNDLRKLYEQRKALYARFADHIIDNNGTPEETVRQILEALK